MCVRLAAAFLLAFLSRPSFAENKSLLNVSYDPTREFYAEVSEVFAKTWSEKTGETLTIKSTHGGSGRQARSVIEGVQADVVTLGLAYDIDAIAAKGLLSQDWQKRLPHNASPYTSTIVFLVRKGNPKGIKDWDDLIKPGVSIIAPDPKSSGGARWNYLAAWAFAKKKYGSDEKAREFVKDLYSHVAVLDSGARGATLTFTEGGQGDVLIAWENEAFLSLRDQGVDKVQLVTPSISILAEPPVAVVDQVVEKHGTRSAAQGFLDFLYSERGQVIAARHFYRPRLDQVARHYKYRFTKAELVTVDSDFGGWQTAQQTHFADGGIFDQIYTRKR
jgi:sulfate transport system substrate-binding protein